MSVPFDHIAQTYDSLFTHSAIGQLQRKHVWSYLERVIPNLYGLEMLEINCGTGEDALMFGQKGFNILATDVSEEMLKITQQKAQQHSMQHKISSRYLDLDAFDECEFDKRFDLILSNFGGLNCISPESLKKLLEKLPSILSPGGRFIGVVMPKFCLWESVYFLLKLQFRKIFRRSTSAEVKAELHGTTVNIWYYQPAQIKQWAKPKFTTVNLLPIGMILPPSYLENFFAERRKLLLRLNRWEKHISGLSFCAGMADHFIIDLQLK